MTQREISNKYFRWLSGLVCGERFSKQNSYDKLLKRLYDTEFTFLLPMDENRAAEGESLRYRFACDNDIDDAEEYLAGPCSVLEMMVALSLCCEEQYMDDPDVGDRTGQWFWGMIVNLGLGSMIDSRYDRRYVDEVIGRFLDREYEPNGKGGLFTVKNCNRDLRDVEIWHQMCWYLGTLI